MDPTNLMGLTEEGMAGDSSDSSDMSDMSDDSSDMTGDSSEAEWKGRDVRMEGTDGVLGMSKENLKKPGTAYKYFVMLG